MADAESNNPSRHSAIYHQTLNPSSHRLKHPAQNTSYGYGDDTEDDEDEDIVEEDANSDDDNVDEDVKDDYNGEIEGSDRYQKKRKRNFFDSGYKFTRKSSEWTDHTTSVLLDAWGDRFLQFGRRSLRSEEWHDISKKVSQAARIVKTDAQCRRRLDTLLKIYKKEKMKVEEDAGYVSTWVYFKKMDMLMSSSSSSQKSGLFCGLDSGEYVFMNPSVYLNCSNGFDEMKDSPENSESWDGLSSREGRSQERGDEASSFRLLADSINKFGEIYEKIEESKRQQMRDLEKMRMEFQRDLELQRRQMLERAQAEMEKMQQYEEDDAEEENVSVENASG